MEAQLNPRGDDAPQTDGRARVRVVVADDHPGYRKGLAAVLALDASLAVVGEAGNGDTAVRVCRTLEPDVALLDVRMPGVGGVEACARIVSEAPGVRILMLTASDDEADLFSAIRAGAAGFLPKDVAAEELVDAVRRVADGQAVIPPPLAALLLAEFTRLHRAAPPDLDGEAPGARLSSRELEVLRLLARGSSNRHIATELSLSEHTVKKHVGRILDKLHVQSRTEAALYAHRRHMAEPDA